MRDTVYKNYLLTVLLFISAFNNVDRNALGIVLQDMKVDLSLSDTQLGFLSGMAFALFYAVMGVPIGRWADTGNRVRIISLTAVLWSATVALCGAAGNFIQLLVIRIGVAVGEAGCLPPALSLIADYFNRAERARAVSRYMLHGPLAFIIGYCATGWLSQSFGWRMTFVFLGVPGFALAAIAWGTLREPRQLTGPVGSTQTEKTDAATSSAAAPKFKEVFRVLWANAAFRHLLFCHSVWYFFGYGLLQWEPTFFVRSHGLTNGEIGTWFALIYGIGGGLGLYLGGEFASRFAPGNERLQLQAGAVAFAVFAVVTAGAFVVTNYYLAFAALALAAVGGCMAQGPLLGTLQTLVPSRMRATSIATIYLFANLIGLGLGPLAAGALSDAFQPWIGQESIRYALIALCPGYFWAAWHLWAAGKTVARDLREVQAEEATVEDTNVRSEVNVVY